MNAADVDWLQHGLALDAMHMTQLIIRGKGNEADLYAETCNYNDRLQLWKEHRS